MSTPTVGHDRRTHGSSHRSEKTSHHSGRSSSNKSPDNTTTTTTKVAEDAIKVSNTAEENYGVSVYAFGEQPFIDLKERVKTLEAEKTKLQTINNSVDKDKTTLEKNLASQKRQIETMEKTIADLSAKTLHANENSAKAQAQEACGISSDVEEKIGVLWPTVDHLKTIMDVQLPTFTKYRALGESINGLRDISQTLENASSGLSNDELEKLLKPKEIAYNKLAAEEKAIHGAVEEAKKNLEDIIAAATFLTIPDYHQKSFSCMQKLSMEKISTNTAKYLEALAACRLELKLFISDLDKVKVRFENAATHINAMGIRLDTKTAYQKLPYCGPEPRVKSPFATAS